MPDYQKVKPGDRLKIPADTYNALMDMASAVDLGVVSGPNSAAVRNSTIIKVQNVSGSAVRELNVMTLKQPITQPPDNNADATDSATNEFKTRIVFEVDTPEDGEEGRWCVLLRPLEDQQIGPAVVLGVTPCRINLADAGDSHVESISGSTVPASSTTGSAQIMWVRGGVGNATATGEQWAIIKIGGGGGGELPTAQYKDQVYKMVSQNQSGWSFLTAHAMG